MKSSIRIATILSAAAFLTCGFAAHAQNYPRERSLLGIPMGASSMEVLAKFGQPNRVESADTQEYLGGGTTMGSSRMGSMMGAPYGMSGASSPYGMTGTGGSPYSGMPGTPGMPGMPGMMGGPGGPGGPMGAQGPQTPESIILRPPYSTGGGGMGRMGGMPGMPGMMGGPGGYPEGGPSAGGPPSYMKAGGGGSPYSGMGSSPYSGMGSSPYSGMGSSPYGGSGPSSPYSGMGGMPGMPGGMPSYGGPQMGGKGAGGTNSQNLKQQYQLDILQAKALVLNSPPVDLDQGEVKWIYTKGTNEIVFLFDHAGEVIQIQSLGYSNGGVTSAGVHLGSTQKQIMDDYGFTDKIYNTTSTDAYGKTVNVMTLDYSKTSNCAFDLIDRHDGKGYRVVRITVALMNQEDL